MKILHTELHDNGLTRIDVIQEWPGAGLNWRYEIGPGILGTLKGQSSGRFYQNQHGETIHGETLDDVIAYAARMARQVLGIASGVEL